MALGIRASFEAQDENQTRYRVRIYQTDYVGTELTLIPTRRIFNLTYQPLTNNIASPLSPSTASIEFYINTEDDRTFVDDVIQYQQSEFYVTIEQDLGSTGTYTPYWRGVVIQDQIDELDAFKGYYTLVCVDGLSRLKDVEYTFDNDVNLGSFRYTRVNQIIYKALSLALPLELWSATDTFLTMTVNWWANGQTYSATDDPTIDQLFDVQAFTEVVDQFNFSFFVKKTCFEVLEILAKGYLARISMCGGSFVFEQLAERANANVKRNTYSKTGVPQNNSLVPLNQTLDQTRESARMAGNIFSNFAALKRVVLEQASYNAARPTALRWNISSGSFPTNASLDFGLYGQFVSGTPLPGTVGQRFEVDVLFDYAAVYTFSTFDPFLDFRGAWVYGIRTAIDVEIKLEDANTATTYYWSATGWQTTVSTVVVGGPAYLVRLGSKISVALSTNQTGSNFPTRRINTGSLPATGRVTVNTSNHRTQRLVSEGPNNWLTLSSSGVTLSGTGIKTTLKTAFPSNTSVRFFNIENDNVNIADFQNEDMGEILLGDGALQSGHILIEDSGSNIIASTSWDYGNETKNLSFAGLLITERLGLQQDVTQKYDGDVMMPKGYDIAISFDNVRYIPLTYSFDAGSGIARADYYALSRFTVSSTVGQDLGEQPDLNDFSDGDKFFKVGGINIGQNQVEDTFYAEEQTTALNNSRTLKAVRNGLKELDVAASGSATLVETDHVVLLKWSGAAGSYTLNLPTITSNMTGQVYEFIIDENFTGSTEVALTPGGSDTINGESTYDIVGGTDIRHFFFRATSVGWY